MEPQTEETPLSQSVKGITADAQNGTPPKEDDVKGSTEVPKGSKKSSKYVESPCEVKEGVNVSVTEACQENAKKKIIRKSSLLSSLFKSRDKKKSNNNGEDSGSESSVFFKITNEKSSESSEDEKSHEKKKPVKDKGKEKEKEKKKIFAPGTDHKKHTLNAPLKISSGASVSSMESYVLENKNYHRGRNEDSFFASKDESLEYIDLSFFDDKRGNSSLFEGEPTDDRGYAGKESISQVGISGEMRKEKMLDKSSYKIQEKSKEQMITERSGETSTGAVGKTEESGMKRQEEKNTKKEAIYNKLAVADFVRNTLDLFKNKMGSSSPNLEETEKMSIQRSRKMSFLHDVIMNSLEMRTQQRSNIKGVETLWGGQTREDDLEEFQREKERKEIKKKGELTMDKMFHFTSREYVDKNEFIQPNLQEKPFPRKRKAMETGTGTGIRKIGVEKGKNGTERTRKLIKGMEEIVPDEEENSRLVLYETSYAQKKRGIESQEELAFMNNSTTLSDNNEHNMLYKKYKLLSDTMLQSSDYMNTVEEKLNVLENSLLLQTEPMKYEYDKLDLDKRFSRLFDNTVDDAIDNYTYLQKKEEFGKKENEQVNLKCDPELFLKLCKFILNDERDVKLNNSEFFFDCNKLCRINTLYDWNVNKDLFYEVFCREFSFVHAKKTKENRKNEKGKEKEEPEERREQKEKELQYEKKGVVESIGLLWFYERRKIAEEKEGCLKKNQKELQTYRHYVHLFNLNNIYGEKMTIEIDSELECLDVIYWNNFFPLDCFYNCIKNNYLMLITQNSFSIFNIHFYFNCSDGFSVSKSENSIYQAVYPYYFNMYLLLIFKCEKTVDKQFPFLAADEINERIFISSEDGHVYEFTFERMTETYSMGFLKRVLWNCFNALKKQVVQTVFSNGIDGNIEGEPEMEQRVQNKYDFLKVDVDYNRGKGAEEMFNEYGKAVKDGSLFVDSKKAFFSEENNNIYYDASKEFHIKYSLIKIMNINSITYFSFSRSKIVKFLVDLERSILYALSSNGTVYIKVLLNSKEKKRKHFLSETIIYTRKELISHLKNITFFSEGNIPNASNVLDSSYYGDTVTMSKKFTYQKSSNMHYDMEKLQLLDIHICSVYEKKNIFFTLIDNNFNVYYLSLVKSITNDAYKVVLKDFQNFPRKRGVRFSAHCPQVEYMKLTRDTFMILKNADIFLEEEEKKEEAKLLRRIRRSEGENVHEPLLSKEEFQRRKENFLSMLNENRKRHPPLVGEETNEKTDDITEELEKDIPYDEYIKELRRGKRNRYKLTMVTCADKNMPTISPNMCKSNYAFEIVNEYYIEEEIIAVLYKKRNHNFHNFFEKPSNQCTRKCPKDEPQFINYDSFSKDNNLFRSSDGITNSSTTVSTVPQRSGSGTVPVSNNTSDNIIPGANIQGAHSSYYYSQRSNGPMSKQGQHVPGMYRKEPSLSERRSAPYELNRGSSSAAFKGGELRNNENKSVARSVSVPWEFNSTDHQQCFSSNKRKEDVANSALEREYGIDRIENTPSCYLYDRTVSDYTDIYDLIIITKWNIYYIVKNSRIERIEKMINLYVTPHLRFNNRNMQNVIKQEEEMKHNLKKNMDMIYSVAEMAPFNKNEKKIIDTLAYSKNTLYEDGEEETIRNERMILKMQYKSIYKYLISFLLEGNNPDDFLYIMWSLLFKYVYKNDVLVLGNFLNGVINSKQLPKEDASQWNLINDNTYHSKESKNITEKRFSGTHRSGISFPPFNDLSYQNKEIFTGKTDVEESRNAATKRSTKRNKEMHQMRGAAEMINYNILHHIYKPSPFKLGFVDKAADYILKQGKLQRDMEKEIKARNLKGMNHLLNWGLSSWKVRRKRKPKRKEGDFYETTEEDKTENDEETEEEEEEEYEEYDEEEEEEETERDNEYDEDDVRKRKENRSSRGRRRGKETKKKDSFIEQARYSSFYVYDDDRASNASDRTKRHEAERVAQSTINRSGNFAYEYLTEQNFDIFFLQNFDVPRNNALQMLSRGLLLFLSRLLKPIMFIRLFSSEQYMSNNVYKFSTEYGLPSRKLLKSFRHGLNKDTGLSVRMENGDMDTVHPGEKFFDMKRECVIRFEPNMPLGGSRKRKRNVFEKSEEEILIGNVPLDCCLNLIEKLKCLSVCVSLVLKSALKKQEKYSSEDVIYKSEKKMFEDRLMQEESYKSMYNDFALLIMKEVQELSSILNFIHFTIEYLLVYSIIISDAYKMKNCIGRKEVEQYRIAMLIEKEKNHVYLPSHLFDMLLKCTFLKAYLSKTYRNILKQSMFCIMKTDKYVPIDFFQGYIIHKTEFLALFLTKRIERMIISNKEKKKLGGKYSKDEKGEVEEELQWKNLMKLSEKRAEYYITHNLQEAFHTSAMDIHKLVILLYKVGYYQCVSVLVEQSMKYFYRSFLYGTGSKDEFIEKSNMYPQYILYDSYNIFVKSDRKEKKKGISQTSENVDYFYTHEFFLVYNNCFLPVERIVYANYIKHSYCSDRIKKKKIKEKTLQFLSTIVNSLVDINFHFYIFHLILYKCKNEFPCPLFDFVTSSPFFYYFVKLNELNIPNVYMYYYEKKNYQDVVIYFAKKAKRNWGSNWSDVEMSLMELYDLDKKNRALERHRRNLSPEKKKGVRFRDEKRESDALRLRETKTARELEMIKERDRKKRTEMGMGMDMGMEKEMEMEMENQIDGRMDEAFFGRMVGEDDGNNSIVSSTRNALRYPYYMFFIDFFTMNKMGVEGAIGKAEKEEELVEENCFSYENVVNRNSLYNEETKAIFEYVCTYMDIVRESPSLTSRMEFTRKCINAKIYMLEQTHLFKRMRLKALGKGREHEGDSENDMEHDADSDSEKEELLKQNRQYSNSKGIRNPFLRSTPKTKSMNNKLGEKPFSRKFYENMLNENLDIDDKMLENYCVADKSVEYEKKFVNNLKKIIENNTCLFHIKDNVLINNKNYFLSLEDLLEQKQNILNQQKLLAEIINLFVYYVYIYCAWDKLKNYFVYLIFGSKKQKLQVLHMCERLNSVESMSPGKGLVGIRSYVSGKLDLMKQKKGSTKGKGKKVNIELTLQIIDAFIQFIKITQKNIHTEESLKSEIYNKSLSFCNKFLPSIYLLKLILSCEKQKEAIDELNENCTCTVNHLIYTERKKGANAFSKYSFYFEKLLDFSFALSINFKKIDFVVNYSGDLIKLQDEKFDNCLYLLVILKLHKFVSSLLKIDHVKKTMNINDHEKKKMFTKENKKAINLKTFLHYVPHIYLDNELNVLMIAQTSEGSGKHTKTGSSSPYTSSYSIFSKISPFSAAKRVVNPDITKMYAYHNLKTSADEIKGKEGSNKKKAQPFTYEEEFDQDDDEVYDETEEEENEEGDEGESTQSEEVEVEEGETDEYGHGHGHGHENENENKNEHGGKDTIGNNLSNSCKNYFKVLSQEDTKTLNYLHKINKNIYEEGEEDDGDNHHHHHNENCGTNRNGKNETSSANELILLSHNNYCFYIVWVTKLLINHKVEYKSLIEVYLKMYNIVKYQKYARLPKHEIVIIIYFLFTLWINGTRDQHSFFYHNVENTCKDKNKNVRFYLKDKYGQKECVTNYSLLMLIQELLSRAEFYVKYTKDAYKREYDISTIILDPEIYNKCHVKKEAVQFLIEFFNEIYQTFEDVMFHLPVLSHIKQFQNMFYFLKNFKNFLSKIYVKVSSGPWT